MHQNEGINRLLYATLLLSKIYIAISMLQIFITDADACYMGADQTLRSYVHEVNVNFCWNLTKNNTHIYVPRQTNNRKALGPAVSPVVN